MAGRFITLKFAGRCADCGATLVVGTKAKWYGRGRVYGLTCHDRNTGNDGEQFMDDPEYHARRLRGDFDFQDAHGVWHLEAA